MTDRGLRRPFRSREFRALWSAEALSVAGDQLARVALAVLVFDRTGSATWSAAAYALTFLPALAGGVLLAGLADRFRRREVMIACDAARAVLVAAMAMPGLPLGALCGLLVAVVLVGSPHTAAQGALLPAVLGDELYEPGLAVRQITGQSAQLLGFAAGGLLVAAVGPEPTLLLNAATFAFSAVLVRIGVADRVRSTPGPQRAIAGKGGGLLAAVVEIATDPQRRTLVLLAWLVGCYVVPEALAAPYAEQIGAGSVTVGLLMAADPLGSVLGAWLFFRFVPAHRRARLIGVLAVVAGLPLLLTALQPNAPATVVLWGLSGMASTAYLLQAQAGFVRATPDRGRGRAIGLAASGVIAAQGSAIMVAGLLADRTTPSTAIAVVSAAGVLMALIGAISWHRVGPEGRAFRTNTVLVS